MTALSFEVWCRRLARTPLDDLAAWEDFLAELSRPEARDALSCEEFREVAYEVTLAVVCARKRSRGADRGPADPLEGGDRSWRQPGDAD